MMRFTDVYACLYAVALVVGVEGAPGGRGRKKLPRTQPIVGGTESTQNRWPWQVALLAVQADGAGFEFLCGGSLISSSLVLTAAHCVKNPGVSLTTVKVVAGEYNRSKVEGTEQERYVSHIVAHPNYKGSLSDLFLHDIAILKLNRSVALNRHVLPVPALADDKTSLGASSTCYMTGWGVSSIRRGKSIAEPNLTSTLMEAEVGLLTNEECNKRRNWNTLIVESQVCASSKRISACLGDSGGPLVCRTDNQSFVQYGITSWGSKDCDGKPSVFTRVPVYTAWISAVSKRLQTQIPDPPLLLPPPPPPSSLPELPPSSKSPPPQKKRRRCKRC